MSVRLSVCLSVYVIVCLHVSAIIHFPCSFPSQSSPSRYLGPLLSSHFLVPSIQHPLSPAGHICCRPCVAFRPPALPSPLSLSLFLSLCLLHPRTSLPFSLSLFSLRLSTSSRKLHGGGKKEEAHCRIFLHSHHVLCEEGRSHQATLSYFGSTQNTREKRTKEKSLIGNRKCPERGRE